MKSGVKTALCLLLTVIVFVGVTVASSLGLFSSLERRFYEPAQIKVFRTKLYEVADAGNSYFSSLSKAFGIESSGFVKERGVYSFVELSPSEEILEKLGVLIEKNKGLDGIRVVDSAGRRVHFSSFRNDYRLDSGRRIYTNYSELYTPSGNPELSYRNLSCFTDDEVLDYRICFDSENQRVIYSAPFSYKGSNFCVLFYVNPRDFINNLIAKKIISVNDKLEIVSSSDNSSGGFVIGLPNSIRQILGNEIQKRWNNFSVDTDEITLVSSENIQTVYTLFTNRTDFGINFSIVFDASMITLPQYVRVLLLVCSFITVCLFILILFNLKKDDDIVIKDRIKRVQLELLNSYFEKNLEKAQIATLVKSKREDLSRRIKKSLGRRGRKHGSEIDAMLEKSWSEIISMLSAQKEPAGVSSINMDEIRRMFEELLASGKFAAAAVSAAAARHDENKSVKQASVIEELEEAEPADEIEPVEELEEAEPADEIEPVEELEEAEPADEIEPVEELEEAESADEIEPVEELEEAEPADEIEPVEELEEAEPADEIEPVEELEEAESADEIEPVEELEEADDELFNIDRGDSSADEKISRIKDALLGDNLDEENRTMEYINFSNIEKNDAVTSSEPLEFSDPTVEDDPDPDMTIVENFNADNPEKMLFSSRLLRIEDNSVHPELLPEPACSVEENIDELYCTDDLEPVSENDRVQFMLTKFGANNNHVTDLGGEAIVEGEDGVYHIAENLSSVELPIDKDFQTLVNSVLK